jgi:hypothetical protein
MFSGLTVYTIYAAKPLPWSEILSKNKKSIKLYYIKYLPGLSPPYNIYGGTAFAPENFSKKAMPDISRLTFTVIPA